MKTLGKLLSTLVSENMHGSTVFSGMPHADRPLVDIDPWLLLSTDDQDMDAKDPR